MTDHADVIREALPALHQLGPTCRCKSCAAHYAVTDLVAERDSWKREATALSEVSVQNSQRAIEAERLTEILAKDNRALAKNAGIYLDRQRAAEARVTELEAALADQCEMNEQALGELRQLHKEWTLMTEQTNFDGEPLIVEVLRGVIDDLDTGPSRAALAKEDTDG